MIFYSLLLLILNVFTLQGVAQEEDLVNPLSQDLVSVKKLRVDNQIGDIFVVVRKDGHLDGHPYIVELRPACGPEAKDWKTLKVADSQSACLVVKDSEKLQTESKKLTVVIHEANSIQYNVNSMREPVNGKIVANDPQCSTNSKPFQFDVSEFCKKKRK